MVRPGCAWSNPETAATNAFQDASSEASLDQMQLEFDQLVKTLRTAGVEVLVVQDSDSPSKPDAVFPNNWVSFHPNNVAVVYPMLSPLRRAERNLDLVEGRKLLDLTSFESEDLYLEGTGSMVIDRTNRVVYAALSPRTHPTPLEHLCAALDYYPLTFEAHGPDGTQVYHTNVVMSIGEGFAVVCSEAIPNPNRVIAELKIARKEVIEISMDQMVNFCGNILQLNSNSGDHEIAMSSTAFESFRSDQIAHLEAHGTIIHSPIPSIERLGGGSVRCMIAEVF